MGKVSPEDHQRAVDRGDYGRPTSGSSPPGPRGKRGCTDVICLLVFVCCAAAWVVVGVIALTRGDPSRLAAPLATDGQRCGVDGSLPYLFYLDITDCDLTGCHSPSVCVEECPSKLYVRKETIEEIDDDTFNRSICSQAVSDKPALLNGWNDGTCATWYIPTKSVAKRCIRMDSDALNDADWKLLKDTVGIDKDTVVDGFKEAQITSQVKELGETIVNDMKKSWPWLLGLLVLAMILCLVYIIIMRWFAWIMVWFSLIGIVALLAYCCYATFIKYLDMKEQGNTFDVSVDAVMALKETWLIFFIFSCIFFVIVVVMIIFLRNRIRIATALISEASRAVGSIKSTLAFPLLPWLLQLGIIAWAVAVGVYLAASSKPVFRAQGITEDCSCSYTNGSICEPKEFNETCSDCPTSLCIFSKHETYSYVGWLHAGNIFGFFWALFFMSAFGEMVLAGAFATWYWTFNKSDVPYFTLTYSLGRTLRYHLGTLAFGSLILAICRMIRLLLEWVDSRLKKFDNCFVRGILCCMKCFFWLLENFIKFLNRNAFIMCAIHGKNFCRSARRAFNLIMRNIIRVFVLDKVTDFLLFLGKLLITGAMIALAFFIFSDDLKPDSEIDVPEVDYYLMPVMIVGFGTYFVASIFFGVYAMAVDTLFLCFLEDLERNDGSQEKPYFMSKKLMKILGKKNKKYKEL